MNTIYNQKMKLWDITNSKTLEYHFFRYLEVLFLLIPKLGNTKMVIEYIPYISEVLIFLFEFFPVLIVRGDKNPFT